MPDADKVREARLRRTLYRMGYILQKSRASDHRDIIFGGYQIVTEWGDLLAGWGNADRGYALDLDDVEACITDDNGNKKDAA